MPFSIDLKQRSLSILFALLVLLLFAQHHAVASLVNPAIPKPVIEDIATLFILFGMYIIFSYKQKLRKQNERMGTVISDLSKSIGGMNRKQSVLEDVGALLKVEPGQSMTRNRKKRMAKDLLQFTATMLGSKEYAFRVMNDQCVTVFESSNTTTLTLPGNKALKNQIENDGHLLCFQLGDYRACLALSPDRETPLYSEAEVEAVLRMTVLLFQ